MQTSSQPASSMAMSGMPQPLMSAPSRPVFQPGMGPNELGEAYRPIKREGHFFGSDEERIAQERRVEEVIIFVF
jgi:transcription initiation factor TFIID subunit TAF12